MPADGNNKVMRLDEVCDFINGIFAGYDCSDVSNNGLQVEGRQEVRRLAFAVDACQYTIDKAIESGADMLIVHHGISWNNGFRRIVGIDAERIGSCLKNGLSLFGMHLPLDAHREIGNNAVLAELMNYSISSWFCDCGGVKIGSVCRFDSPVLLSEVLKKAQTVISPRSVLFDNSNGSIRSIGFISGGGEFACDDCVAENIDCLFTGEFRHASFHNAAEKHVSIISAGHYDTENTGIRALMKLVGERLGLETVFIESPTLL